MRYIAHLNSLPRHNYRLQCIARPCYQSKRLFRITQGETMSNHAFGAYASAGEQIKDLTCFVGAGRIAGVQADFLEKEGVGYDGQHGFGRRGREEQDGAAASHKLQALLHSADSGGRDDHDIGFAPIVDSGNLLAQLAHAGIERVVRAVLQRTLAAIGERIDDDYAQRPALVSQLGQHLPVAARAQDEYAISRLHSGAIDATDAAGQWFDQGGSFKRKRIRQGQNVELHVEGRHADVFGQPARIQARGTEGGALRERPALAVVTDHAGNVMMQEDALPDRELLDAFANFHYDANGFMSGIERRARPHVPLHHIAGAQPARLHLYQQFAGAYFGNGHLYHAHILIAMILNR